MPYKRINPLGLRPEVVGLMGLNPFMAYNSGSRQQMFCTHIGQALTVEGGEPKRIQSGVEREYGKYTHKIQMPVNAVILRVIHKYPRTLGMDSVEENPLISILYEDADSPNREICLLDLTRYHYIHQHFGFNYVFTDVLNQLSPGVHVPAGTVLAHSPAIQENEYGFGLNTNIAFMSLPAVIEDGAIVSESWCKRATTKGYGTRIVSFGKNSMPLNLYGDDTHYKAFPNIGDFIREDGLLFALRQYDETNSVVDMSTTALKIPNQFDKHTYGYPNAKIVDIVVHKGSRDKTQLPGKIAEQCLRYHAKTVTYSEALISEYKGLLKRYQGSLNISPYLNNRLVEATATIANKHASKIAQTFKGVPLDEWMVHITYEYTLVPTIGFKLTDMHGG